MEMRGSEDSFMFQRKEKTNVEDCEKYCRRRNVRARRQHHLGAEKHLTKNFEKMKTRPYQNQPQKLGCAVGCGAGHATYQTAELQRTLQHLHSALSLEESARISLRVPLCIYVSMRVWDSGYVIITQMQ
jgi:hypothetical protein